MKIIVRNATVIVLSILSTCLWASNFTQDNVRKTQDLISKTMDAYGGAEKLQGLNQIIVDYDVQNVSAGQSRKPEPPWDTSTAKRKTAFDFVNQIAVTDFVSNTPGNRNSNKTISTKEEHVNLDRILKTKTVNPAREFDTESGPSMRSNGTFLAKRLQQFASSARHLGEIEHNSAKHDLVSFTIPGGPALTLYIDQKSHLITKSERVVGPFLVEYYFSDYKTVDGIQFSFVNSYTVDGAPSQTFTAKSYDVNKPLDKLVEIPDGYQILEAALPRDMKTHKLADNVYWVTQNFQNSLFVEFEDHLVMVGGLPGVTQRIEEIKKALPDKPVKYTVMTHHHSDHIGGSREVQDAGISFIAVKEHEKVIRETLDEKDRGAAKFEFVKNKRVFKDKSQTLEIYDIGPTDHTEHFLLAYLPEHGIIFEADHIRIPDSGPAPYRSASSGDFVEAIQKRKLKVKQIASAHSARTGTFEEMMESYNKSL